MAYRRTAFVDERVADFAQILLFAPASVNGVPIDGRTRLSITLGIG